jgi:hypothetical protein
MVAVLLHVVSRQLWLGMKIGVKNDSQQQDAIEPGKKASLKSQNILPKIKTSIPPWNVLGLIDNNIRSVAVPPYEITSPFCSLVPTS